MRNDTFLLLQDTTGKKIIFNRSDKTLRELPDVFLNAVDITITDNNVVLARIGQTIISYNLSSKAQQTVFPNAAGFTLLHDTIYIAQKDSAGITLQTGQWGENGITNIQPLFSAADTKPLPSTDSVRLIISDKKELFILENDSLYRVNSELELISSHVISADFDSHISEFTFRTQSELWFYNFLTARPQLLTRNTEAINSFTTRTNLGYGFIATPNGLEVLEIDSRNQQNLYTLVSASPVWAATVSDNLKTVIALVNDALVIIPITK